MFEVSIIIGVLLLIGGNLYHLSIRKTLKENSFETTWYSWNGIDFCNLIRLIKKSQTTEANKMHRKMLWIWLMEITVFIAVVVVGILTYS